MASVNDRKQDLIRVFLSFVCAFYGYFPKKLNTEFTETKTQKKR